MIWAENAISEPFRGAAFGLADFATLQTKAAVLTVMGRSQEADAIMDKAIHLPGVAVFLIFIYSRSLLLAGRNEKAIVSIYNQKNLILAITLANFSLIACIIVALSSIGVTMLNPIIASFAASSSL